MDRVGTFLQRRHGVGMKRYREMWGIMEDMASVKLRMNAHKGNIEDLDVADLIARAREELDELQGAIENEDGYLAILEECGDTLNFMTAAVLKTVRQYRRRNDDDSAG